MRVKNSLSFNFGMSYFSDVPKSAQGLSKSAQKSAQALVERSPKRPIGLAKSAQKSAQALVEKSPKEMRSPRRPQGQRKSGKICIL